MLGIIQKCIIQNKNFCFRSCDAITIKILEFRNDSLRYESRFNK